MSCYDEAASFVIRLNGDGRAKMERRVLCILEHTQLSVLCAYETVFTLERVPNQESAWLNLAKFTRRKIIEH